MRISDWSSDVCSSDLAMNHIAASAPPRQQTGLAILMGQDHRTLVSEHGALNRHHLSSLDTNGKMGRIECVPLQPEAGASITCRCSGPCAWVSDRKSTRLNSSH